ncbi:PDR/VanB family oxidoreductase [Arthrobacter rhombi]|uniref:PDR/VanB family oxidoreductase n=1 Tax=Arthrobacter rhombi TaxID=71253 RepID=UPI0031CF54E4
MTITDQKPVPAPATGRTAPGPVTNAIVRTMRLEAEGVLSLEIEPIPGGTLPEWQPGAHLDIVLAPGLVRQYSLCSRPGQPWRVAVLREPASRGGSNFVHTSLRPGAVIGVRGPRNNFALAPARSYRFLAGGIGITPILAMVREAEAGGVPWTLDYLGRSRTSMAFLDELLEFGEKVRIHADDVDGRFDLSGHLEVPAPGMVAYACGPGGLLGVLLAAAENWPAPELLRVERFVADQAGGPQADIAGDPSADGTASGDTSPESDAFVVELNDGATLEIPVDQSILQTLEDHGYAPLNSCREGICGTCETGVISGDVDHRDSLLSEDEKAASETMMICVSRACGGCRLRLDI